MKTFTYKSLMELITRAEDLGWEDTYPDCTDPDFDEYIVDCIEDDCVRFIEDLGYTVECIA